MNQYRHLSAFPENREVLQALKARRRRHRHPEQRRPRDARRRGAQRRPRRAARSRAERRQRPQVQDAPRRLRLGPEAIGIAAGADLFVSCNGWDALGATWYGYRTLWVNRYQLPFEELGTQPTRIGTHACATCSPFSILKTTRTDHDRRRPPSTACRWRPSCTASSKTRCCPAPASTARSFWKGFDAIVHDLAPKNVALLAERDRLQSGTGRLAQGEPGPDPRHGGLPRLPGEDRLPGAAARRA